MNIEKGTKSHSDYLVELSENQINLLLEGKPVMLNSNSDTVRLSIKGPKDMHRYMIDDWIPYRNGEFKPRAGMDVYVTLSNNRVVPGHIDESGEWAFDVYLDYPYRVVAWRPVVPHKVDEDEAIATLQTLADGLDDKHDLRTKEAINIAIKRLSASTSIMRILDDEIDRIPDNSVRSEQIISLRNRIGNELYADWDERTKYHIMPNDNE